MARKKRTDSRKAKQVISIIVDGDTEVWYFQMMKKEETFPGKVDIKPELPKKKKLKEQFEMVRDNSRIYDKVYWVIDFDTIQKEDREQQGQRIQDFNKYLRELEGCDNVEVFINNPCLEFWHLLHFKNTGKYFSVCDSAQAELIKELPDYKKSMKYYKQQPNNIYKRLKPNLSEALKNAGTLGAFDKENPQKAKAEMYRLFEALGLKGE
jgi:hypothetical protein